MTTEIPTFPTLYKRTAAGGVQTWQIRVEPDGDAATIITTYGLQHGQQQTIRDTVKEGKNAGKKNATTPLQQAISEAQSKWDKQKTRRCYGLTVEESGEARDEAPMLAQAFEKHLNKVQWDSAYGQPRLDGFRCLAKCRGGKVSLWSREGKPIETMGHIVEQLSAVMSEDDTLDGELYIPGEKFQKIASLIKRQQTGSERVQYHVYDAMLETPFIDRYQQALAKLRRLPSGLIVPVATRIISDPEKLMEFQASCVADGFEGAMLRHGLEAYDAGKRSAYLLKVKTFQDAEFLITGVREGRGTHAGMAIFVCQTDQGVDFEVLAHGTHEEKRAAWENRAMIVGKKRLTVKFQEWTSSEQPVPRFPVALRYNDQL